MAGYPCRACDAALVVDREVAIRGVDVSLFRCPDCGLFEFPEPTWLDAAYEDPIADIDTGLVSRCIGVARSAEAVVRAEGRQSQPVLDYGGGYGLLTRLLLDRGLDARHFDPYAANLFAQSHEGGPDEAYGCVTLVEVIEHLTDPLSVLQNLAKTADIVLVSTVLVPDAMTDIRDWWYLIPDLGQHITFFRERSLAELGRRAGYQLLSDGEGLHLFTKGSPRPLTRLAMRDARLATVVGRALRARQASR